MSSLATFTKYPGELRAYAVDFADQPEIAAGETLSGTPTMTATLQLGSGTLTIAGVARSGTKVAANISGGTIGDNFSLLVTVATNAGHTLQAVASLDITQQEA